MAFKDTLLTFSVDILLKNGLKQGFLKTDRLEFCQRTVNGSVNEAANRDCFGNDHPVSKGISSSALRFRNPSVNDSCSCLSSLLTESLPASAEDPSLLPILSQPLCVPYGVPAKRFGSQKYLHPSSFPELIS